MNKQKPSTMSHTEIDYTDGAHVESLIQGVLKVESKIDSLASIAADKYANWPIRYHLSPERSYLLRHLDFSGLRVLEIGAGMGALSRYLAEQSAELTVVEGTRGRFSALSERLRDLKNWKGVTGNFGEISLNQKFDVVCLLGVWEYSELFTRHEMGSAHGAFLERASSLLDPGGVLILAIENQLGLKYWGGAPEDHTSRSFDGICGYRPTKSPRTFSRKGILQSLSEVGLKSISENFPFPDYKMPCSVLSARLIDESPGLAASVAGHLKGEWGNHLELFPNEIVLHEVAKAGLLKELANSFLFLASFDENSPTRKKLLARELEKNEIGWHYAANRRFPTVTTFSLSSTGIQVEKKLLQDATNRHSIKMEAENIEVTWQKPKKQGLFAGTPLRLILYQCSYFEEWALYLEFLQSFIEWSFLQWRTDGQNNLLGQSLDAVCINASMADNKSPNGLNASIKGEIKSPRQYPPQFLLFDLEWQASSPIPESWFIFRNVYSLREDRFFVQSAPFESLSGLYEQMCSSLGVQGDLSNDILREARFQSLVTNSSSVDSIREALEVLFTRKFRPVVYPRFATAHDAALFDLESLRNRILSLEKEIHHRTVETCNLQLHTVQLAEQNRGLKAILDTPPHRLVIAIKELLKRIPVVFHFIKWLIRLRPPWKEATRV